MSFWVRGGGIFVCSVCFNVRMRWTFFCCCERGKDVGEIWAAVCSVHIVICVATIELTLGNRPRRNKNCSAVFFFCTHKSCEQQHTAEKLSFKQRTAAHTHTHTLFISSNQEHLASGLFATPFQMDHFVSIHDICIPLCRLVGQQQQKQQQWIWNERGSRREKCVPYLKWIIGVCSWLFAYSINMTTWTVCSSKFCCDWLDRCSVNLVTLSIFHYICNFITVFSEVVVIFAVST